MDLTYQIFMKLDNTLSKLRNDYIKKYKPKT